MALIARAGFRSVTPMPTPCKRVRFPSPAHPLTEGEDALGPGVVPFEAINAWLKASPNPCHDEAPFNAASTRAGV